MAQSITTPQHTSRGRTARPGPPPRSTAATVAQHRQTTAATVAQHRQTTAASAAMATAG